MWFTAASQLNFKVNGIMRFLDILRKKREISSETLFQLNGRLPLSLNSGTIPCLIKVSISASKMSTAKRGRIQNLKLLPVRKLQQKTVVSTTLAYLISKVIDESEKSVTIKTGRQKNS